jgi:hypothetical protein
VKKVLFIEWSSKGRDFEIDLPLMYFFEIILKWEVEYLSIFHLPKILTTQPDMIIMSNTMGANKNLEISRLIEKSKIPLFSHVSEGMFREQHIEGFVFGWNKKEKRFSETISTLWSKKSYDMAIKYFPQLKGFYKISGSVGFDKYCIYSKNKLPYLNYKKIIGYAAFDFHNFINNYEQKLATHGKIVVDKVVKWIKVSSKLLFELVKNNPDILFLLKPHPGDGSKTPMEFKDIVDFDNVVIVEKHISIVDVISNSDIWLNINSSTNLEAWLLDKPSISFNTDESMFSSDILYGSVLENDYQKIQEYINEYYLTGKIHAFEKKVALREQLIFDYIGFKDGLNHVRFMSFLKPFIEKIENGEVSKGKWNISFLDKIKGYLGHYICVLSRNRHNTPLLKRWASLYEMFNDKEIDRQKQIRYPDFDTFYASNKNDIMNIYDNWGTNWKKELGIK